MTQVLYECSCLHFSLSNQCIKTQAFKPLIKSTHPTAMRKKLVFLLLLACASVSQVESATCEPSPLPAKNAYYVFTDIAQTDLYSLNIAPLIFNNTI